MQFEDLQLQPGASIQLLLTGGEEVSYSLDTVYVGCLVLHSIVVAMPSEKSDVELVAGMEISVALNLPTGVATFSSIVDVVADQPYCYLHLRYPEQIRFRQIRNSARVRVEMPVRLAKRNSPEDMASLKSQVIDISATGLKLVTNNNIGQIGDELTIHIAMYFAGVERLLSVAAVIRARLGGHSDKSEMSNIYGVQFQTMNDEQKILLHAFVLNGLQAGDGLGL